MGHVRRVVCNLVEFGQTVLTDGPCIYIENPTPDVMEEEIK